MINLSNYEDWFLLYADGELTVAEQEAVLKFVDGKQQSEVADQGEHDAGCAPLIGDRCARHGRAEQQGHG